MQGNGTIILSARMTSGSVVVFISSSAPSESMLKSQQ